MQARRCISCESERATLTVGCGNMTPNDIQREARQQACHGRTTGITHGRDKRRVGNGISLLVAIRPGRCTAAPLQELLPLVASLLERYGTDLRVHQD